MRVSFSKATTYLLTVLLGMFSVMREPAGFRPGRQRFTLGSGNRPSRGGHTGGQGYTHPTKRPEPGKTSRRMPSGEYNFRNLPPGIYDLSVTAPAFESFVRKGIELAVNQTARV